MADFRCRICQHLPPSLPARSVVSCLSNRLKTLEVDRSKLGQSDERLIYEVQHGSELLDVDFSDILQQRLHTMAKQREELQHLEVELRAQVIARSEIVGMQNNYNTHIKERADANAKLQEQLHEKEQKIHELERKMGEKERELHAIRLDNEAAWAKEDLLMEQSKELQSYRRERDNSEAERLQQIKQIHDLQEHLQEKDRQLMELGEQHRIAQETILFKDEQLREAQAWITRAQEMDALQSTTNHTLQAEVRERMEHYNQLWLVYQRQFCEMGRLHLHIQQLQLELADLKEKSGSKLDGSLVYQTNLKDAPGHGQSNGSQLDLNGNGSLNANSGSLHNANSESASGGNTPTQFHDALRLNPPEHGKGSGIKEKHVNPVSEHGKESKMGHSNLTMNASSSEPLANPKSFTETSTGTALNADSADGFVSAGQNNDMVGKPGEGYLLDERALLASIARTIGSSGRIRISSTLHNRLGKILAPLHWHDYKKKYGKLDDFVANHPELFFIEADCIQLRDGAQETIAATAAVAKVAAAATASPSAYSSMFPSVAVTPLAQSHRPKKPSLLEYIGPAPLTILEHPSAVQHQNLDDGFLCITGGTSNVKIFSKFKDHIELNGSDKPAFSQNKDASLGLSGVSSVGRQPNRATGAASSLRR